MECLDDNTLAAVFERRLGLTTQLTLDAHANECGSCRALLAAYARVYAATGNPCDATSTPDIAELPVALFARLRAEKRIGTTLSAKWTLERVLGVGGSAEVYAASHRNGNKVAIKLLRPEHAAAAPILRRFLREGYVANRVAHSGTVRVVDDDVTEEGLPYLVMDLVDGRTLREIVQQDGPFDVERAIGVALEMLDVVAAAHAEGIVHRDIKPDNVVVAHDGVVKVLDFGIARLRDATRESTHTESGLRIGTPAYMAPEQARGEVSAVGPRSDVWSVGATLVFALTGKSPRAGATREQELFQAMTMPALALRALRADVPAPVARVIDRALAFRASDRFPGAREMQNALRDAASLRGRAGVAGVVPRVLGRRAVTSGLVGMIAVFAVSASAWLALRSPRAHPDTAATFPIAPTSMRAVAPLAVSGFASDSMLDVAPEETAPVEPSTPSTATTSETVVTVAKSRTTMAPSGNVTQRTGNRRAGSAQPPQLPHESSPPPTVLASRAWALSRTNEPAPAAHAALSPVGPSVDVAPSVDSSDIPRLGRDAPTTEATNAPPRAHRRSPLERRH